MAIHNNIMNNNNNNGSLISEKHINLNSSSSPCNYPNSNNNSNRSTVSHHQQRSMSKWLGLVLMLMMVIICQTEAKSLYGGAAGLEDQQQGGGASATGDQQREEAQRQHPAFRQPGELGDILDYGAAAAALGNRDEESNEVGGGNANVTPLENAFLNFLYMKQMQMLQRLRSPGNAYHEQQSSPTFNVPLEPALIPYSRQRQLVQQDGLRKRTSSYWKQCAFNAVSCFG